MVGNRVERDGHEQRPQRNEARAIVVAVASDAIPSLPEQVENARIVRNVALCLHNV